MAKRTPDVSAAADAAPSPTPMPSAEVAVDASAEPATISAVLIAMLPTDEQALPGAVLFAEACLAYGIDPDPAVRPLEVLPGDLGRRWRYYPADEIEGRPAQVKFVTAGGVKIAHPIDADFEQVLRRWLRAYHVDPKTREIVADPLPADLTLPREAVTGRASKTEHRLEGGYLRQLAARAARGER